MLNMFHKVVWFGISLESGDKVITVPPEGDMNVWTKFHGSPFHYWCQKWEIQQSHWDSFSGDHECVHRISWQSINSSWDFSKVVERLTNKQTNPLSNIFTSQKCERSMYSVNKPKDMGRHPLWISNWWLDQSILWCLPCRTTLCLISLPVEHCIIS